MSITIFLFHPNSASSRVNKALAQAASELDDVTVRDMYSLYPSGQIDVAAEQAILESSNRIVLQFPMYWYSSPALTKQWLDEVLTYGWAYGSSGTVLHGKELTIAVTAGASGYTHDKVGYTISELLRPFQATSNLIGTTFLTPFVVEGALGISDSSLTAHARAYQEYLAITPRTLGSHE